MVQYESLKTVFQQNKERNKMVKNYTYDRNFFYGRSILCLICIYIFMTDSISIAQTKQEKIRLEADYILQCQHVIFNDPSYGAINTVFGPPTWVVPREMAMAILGLIIAADVLNEHLYREMAQLAAGYLERVQDDDGAWFNQYHDAEPGDHKNLSNEFALSKSPTQTAEVMIAFYQLGYQASRDSPSMATIYRHQFLCHCLLEWWL